MILNIEEILQYQKTLKAKAPLIHCITNPISIHDCANVVLAAGGRPMMAEHPAEVEEITATAGALALNLGNITDARKASILISGRYAMSHEIPVMLDLVGIGCSAFRREIVNELLKNRDNDMQAPLVLKGNMSEIRALADAHLRVSGVDAAPEDVIREDNKEAFVAMAKQLAKQYHAVVLISGETDLVTDGEETILITAGHEMMSHITGTGCMLGVLTAAYMSVMPPLLAAGAACQVFGTCGERAALYAKGTGTYQIALLDELFLYKA